MTRILLVWLLVLATCLAFWAGWVLFFVWLVG